MSENTPQSAFKRAFLRGSALSFLMAGTLCAAITVPASAASLTTQQGRHTIYEAPLSDIADIDTRQIDWRTPSVDVYFDVPESDWIDDIELLVSARPDGNVSPRMPIMVSFNGAKSVPIYAQGRAFDARVKLNKAHIRPRRNKVTFTYHAPAGYKCLSEQNGTWNLDFTQSHVVLKARAKSRAFRIGEFEDRFSTAATAPSSVSLIAVGQDAGTLQMLAAQGVGLRSKALPDFKLTPGRTDMEIIMGRRDELGRTVTDKSILTDSGPRAALHEGRPMRLVLTGDTDAQVLQMAKAFAQHSLPGTRRRGTSAGEIEMQPSFTRKTARINNSTKLNTLPSQVIGQDWGTSARIHTFKVSDPSVSSGRVLLRLSSSKYVSDDSTVQVKLNGQNLGYTALDSLRKSVAFDFPQGSLLATGNTLEILPKLSRKDKSDTCGYAGVLPAFTLGDGSKIDLRRNETSPMTELSHFAATGAPFSAKQGEDTVIVMASNSPQNRAASLKVLAQLAKVSGQSWTNARVANAANINLDYNDKNVLVLGPKTRAVDSLFKAGPKSLSAALQGRTLRGDALYQTASIETFAAASEAETLKVYAARQNQKSRISRGGVAALYPSPSNPTRLVGVISTSSGGAFKVAADQLVKDDHWNKLEGSVTRWDKSSVLMAQTALPEPGAMRVARMRALEDTPAIDFAGMLFADIAAEAKSVSSSAGDMFALLRANVKDKFSQPLQASNAPAKSRPAVKTAAKPAPIKSAGIKSEPAQSTPAKPAQPVKVADNRAAQVAVPSLRGFSAPTSQKPGTSLQNLKMPELNVSNMRAKMAAHTLKVQAYADKTAARTNGLITAFEKKTSPMTVLLFGIGLFLFSLTGFIRAGRRKVRYYTE